MVEQRPEGAYFADRAVQYSYEQVGVESVVDGVDRMRDEGGISPELPHRPERVDWSHGTTNPIDVED